MWPVIAGGAALLGLALYASSSKAKSKVPLPAPPAPAKGKQAPATKTPDFAPEPAVVFKAEPAVKKVDVADTIDLIKAGAVQVATEATGAQVFKKQDGGLVTVMAPVEIEGGGAGATGQAMVNTKTGPMNLRKGPGTNTAVVGSANKGSILDLTGPTVSGPGSAKGWAPVKQGKLVGYAAVDYLEMGS